MFEFYKTSQKSVLQRYINLTENLNFVKKILILLPFNYVIMAEYYF